MPHLNAVVNSVKTVGLAATLQLAKRHAACRLGEDSSRLYEIPVRGYSHPIVIRGGNGSDGFVFVQILITKYFDALSDLGSPRLIIDAGANIGLASVYFLNRYPSVKVIAIEPDPANYKICEMNLAPYADRVTLLNGAVWSASGRLVLEKGEFDWNSSVRSADSHDQATVRAFDMRSLIAIGGGGDVDLLKMDIEGGEREIFKAGADQWLPALRNIVIELHGIECETAFLEALQRYDYATFSAHNLTVCENLRVKRANAAASGASVSGASSKARAH